MIPARHQLPSGRITASVVPEGWERTWRWRTGDQSSIAVLIAAGAMMAASWSIRNTQTWSPRETEAARPCRLEVRLNAATFTELNLLPGVGPKLAQRILEGGQRRGGWTTVEQWREVPGIGPRKLTGIRPLVRP